MSGESGFQLRRAWAALVVVGVIVIGVLLLNQDTEGAPSTTETTTPTPDSTAHDSTAPVVATTAPVAPSSTAPPETTEPTVTVPPSTTPTTLPPVDDPGLGADAERAVPLGEQIDVGVWRIGVTSAVLDATQTVLDFVDFNDPPDTGNQYVLVELSGIQTGPSIAQPVFDWELVHGPDRFTPGERECGVFPNSIIDVEALSTGDDFSANICFEVPTDAVDEQLLLTLGLFAGDGTEWFFELAEGGS